ncbi:hypothetical protein ACEE08_09670 [Staphylococcus rostri]|uniref:hypothetical protein n=1 Tax=Staphylococcus rostri TaxID=522262 RepID=UPI00147664F8|nr:hypothetical protein [Staphylococcus rostri]
MAPQATISKQLNIGICHVKHSDDLQEKKVFDPQLYMTEVTIVPFLNTDTSALV